MPKHLFQIGVIPWNKGAHLSEEIREKISNALKGRKPKNFGIDFTFKGRKHSEETKEKLKIINLGKKQSEETIKKRSLALKGRKVSKKTIERIGALNRGKKLSLETRQKISLAHKNKKRSPCSEETKRKISEANLGSKRSTEARKKMSMSSMGKKLSEETKRKISEWQILHPNKKFHDTSIEIKMRELLDLLGIEYLFQVSLEKISLVDFYIPSKKLVIYCDGCYWHGCSIHHPERTILTRERDNFQTTRLQELGYEVLRFWEHDIKNMTTLQL